MPNSKENNATLLGIDVDQNGIRDDIDRKIAEAYGDNNRDYRLVTGYFRASQSTLENPTKENVKKTWERLSCLGKGYEDVVVIEKQFLNTPQRRQVDAQAFAGSTLYGVCVPE
jgi:hypothetical protein